MMRRVLMLALPVAAVACLPSGVRIPELVSVDTDAASEPDDPVDGDADVDADADADADADSDLDTGVDVDPVDTSEPVDAICLVIEDFDHNGDGVVDERGTGTFDVNGRIVLHTSDVGNDGTIDGSYAQTWDASGNLLVFAADYGADGTVDHTEFRTYDVDGHMVTHDVLGQYGYLQRYTYTYDARGNVLTEVNDQSNRGSGLTRTTYTYDADDNRLSWEMDHVDSSGVHYRYTYTYDSYGSVLTESFDGAYVYADGTIDRVTTSTYAYDEAGNVVAASTDYQSDGVVDSQETSTYDAFGNRLTFTRGNSRYVWTYDARGNVLSEEVFHEDTRQQRTNYEYDVHGRIIRATNAWHDDHVGQSTTTTYTCPPFVP